MTRMEELDRLIRAMPPDDEEPIEKPKRKPRFAVNLGTRFGKLYGSREFWEKRTNKPCQKK